MRASRCEVRGDPGVATRLSARHVVPRALGFPKRLSCVACATAIQTSAITRATEGRGTGGTPQNPPDLWRAARGSRELAAEGFRASLGTIKRVRRELGLCCVQQKRRFRVTTTDSRHALPVAPNLLAQCFTVTRPDEVWTADITYVATDEGWLYVAAIKDLFAGEIVGRAFGERKTTDLVVRALEQAVITRVSVTNIVSIYASAFRLCSCALG